MADLAQRLVELGLVTGDQLDTARFESAKVGRSVWFTLVKLEYLSEERIFRFFAQEANVPFVRLSDYRIRQSALNVLEEGFCRRNTVIPLCIANDTLFVACNNPFDTALLDTIGRLSRCSVEPLLASSSAISQALDYYWRLDNISFEAAKFLVRAEPVKGLSFWRESERVEIDWPLSLAVPDEALSLAFSSNIQGRAHDISRDCSAIGLYLPLYIPRGIKVEMDMVPYDNGQPAGRRFNIAGEVVQAYMSEQQNYSIGIRLFPVDRDTMADLVRYASKP